jgi:hypothetical protein
MELEMRRRFWVGFVGALTLLTVGAGGYMATSTRVDGFDAAKWKAQENNTARNNPRQGMVRDLEKELRQGMTRDEVVALLGKPDLTEQSRYVYEIGASMLDSLYFVIEFDTDGKLRRHFIEQS